MWTLLQNVSNEEAARICNENNIPFDIVRGLVTIPSSHLKRWASVAKMDFDPPVPVPGEEDHFDVAELYLVDREADQEETVKIPENQRRARDRYIEYCSNKHRNVRDELQKRVEQFAPTVDQKRTEYLEALRRQLEIQAQINEIDEKGVRVVAEKDLGDEFDAIAKSIKVANISYDQPNDCMVVDTKKLKHKDVGMLGTFRIRIFLSLRGNSDHYGIDMVQIETLEVIRYHPHNQPGYRSAGSGDGFCLGSAVPIISAEVKNFQLGAIIDTVIQYLEEG